MLSTLSVTPKKFCFSANVDGYFEFAVRAFNDDFAIFPKRLPSKALNHNEISKINKKSLFIRNKKNFNKKSSCGIYYMFQLLYISNSKITIYSSGNVKTLLKRSLVYKTINNHPFSNTLYIISKIHIVIEGST